MTRDIGQKTHGATYPSLRSDNRNRLLNAESYLQRLYSKAFCTNAGAH